MFTIFWQTIKDKKITSIIYCLAGILMLWMYVVFFPTIAEQAEKFNELIKTYPESFLKAFGIEEFSFDTLEKFLAVEQFSIIWPLLVILCLFL